MKYARMKVQITRTNPPANISIPTNNTTNKSHEETNQQLADPTIVAKVSFYRNKIRFNFNVI